LHSWWDSAKPHAEGDAKPIDQASIHGGRMALGWTALVPATMAVLYLFLIILFRLRGGYKQVHIEGSGEGAQEVE
jgi:hypothetical protein